MLDFADVDQPTLDEVFQILQLQKKMIYAINRLDRRSQDIIKFKFGIGEDYDCDHSLQECSEKFKLCSTRIRQIVERAFRKLRLDKTGLRDFIEGETRW